ncbi:MAG: nickel pincer cofactor biosynthesis protein LarB [Bacteroidales bacterium]|nr:nickel pincer cofactor biosynthesis protein LarB [Bacteroidales bacterium]
MNTEYIKHILESVKRGETSVEQAMESLKNLPYSDLGYAKVDHHRQIRRGYPEVIFCAGKTPEHVRGIVENMLPHGENILATRASEDAFEEVKSICPTAEYNKLGRTITIRQKEISFTTSYIAIVTAGTSDIPIAEEAAVTAEIFGNRTERVFDVGVAGIHRLYDKLDILRGAKVLVVIAGMEGALPSVVGGLVDKPVIAVPTSIGYGAAFNGLAALLGMLTSCTSGIGVVNIDNGFGAAYLASMINKL